MYARGVAALAVVGVVALTATGVRIGNHLPYVRVIVDFNGKVPAKQVVFDMLTPTMATLHVARPGIATQTTGRTGHGVRVALQPGGEALHITASSARNRFKYVSYAVVTERRLAIDLWKSAPPPADSRLGYRDCLDIRSWHVKKGSVSASGVERPGVFENTFQVVVRGENGTVLGRRTVTGGPAWSTTVKYTPRYPQAGTLEAVALSPKDGALACLYEVRVTLPGN